MAAEIEKARPDCAVETTGEDDKLGMFLVVADGQQLWSKHETGTFPEPAALIDMLPKPPTS